MTFVGAYHVRWAHTQGAYQVRTYKVRIIQGAYQVRTYKVHIMVGAHVQGAYHGRCAHTRCISC